MIRTALVRSRASLIAIALASLVPCSAHAEPQYSDEGAKTCIDCHETESVMGILDTAHGNASDPKTPAAKKECQSCHGPSAAHIQFPMQVANLHFGKGSNTRPEVQNQVCLECHAEGDRQEWHASAHGFERVVCSTCHSVHDPKKIVPVNPTLSVGCSREECHGNLMGDFSPAEFSHAVGKPLGDQGELGCTGCHNPHGPMESGRCTECHAGTPEVLAKQSAKARRYHEVAARTGTECMRCHKGIAHPIPPLVLEEYQNEMRELLGD